MNLLTRFGLERSRFTVTVMAGLLVFGIALYPNFPKREDPVVVIRTAVVSAQFPGMAPAIRGLPSCLSGAALGRIARP